MANCPNCGSQVDNNAAFCTNCGANLVNVYSEQPSYQAETMKEGYPPQQQPVYYREDIEITEDMLPRKLQPVSVGAFFGYSILFSIPVVGFIMLLVVAFSSGFKKSLRNYAKSILLAILIVVLLIVLLIALAIVGSVFGIGLLEELLYYI